MEMDSLPGLKAVFEDWRRKKRHAKEAVPGELVARAQRAIELHGIGPVARATKLDRTRLRTGRGRLKKKRSTTSVPAYSRVSLALPVMVPGPFAELETPAGLKVRLFAQTAETLDLLSSLCGAVGTR